MMDITLINIVNTNGLTQFQWNEDIDRCIFFQVTIRVHFLPAFSEILYGNYYLYRVANNLFTH